MGPSPSRDISNETAASMDEADLSRLVGCTFDEDAVPLANEAGPPHQYATRSTRQMCSGSSAVCKSKLLSKRLREDETSTPRRSNETKTPRRNKPPQADLETLQKTRNQQSSFLAQQSALDEAKQATCLATAACRKLQRQNKTLQGELLKSEARASKFAGKLKTLKFENGELQTNLVAERKKAEQQQHEVGQSATTFDYENGYYGSNSWMPVTDQNALRMLRTLQPGGCVGYTIDSHVYEATWQPGHVMATQRNTISRTTRRVRPVHPVRVAQGDQRSQKAGGICWLRSGVIGSFVYEHLIRALGNSYLLPLHQLDQWQAGLPAKPETVKSRVLAELGDRLLSPTSGRRYTEGPSSLFVKPAVCATWLALLAKVGCILQCNASVRVGFHGSDGNGYEGIKLDPLGMDSSKVTHGAVHGHGLYFGWDYALPGKYNKGTPGMCVAALILLNDVDNHNGRTGALYTLIGTSGIVVHDTRYVLPLGLLVPEMEPEWALLA